jgi:alpha-ketoglutarate-dependent taurine dioxygenase
MASEKSVIPALKDARPTAIPLSGVDLVRVGHLQPSRTLPLVLQPAITDIDLVGWTASNRDFIEAQLLKHGGLLFRGFDVRTTSEFEKFAEAACDELFCDYGDLPREQGNNRVYQSTPYPEHQTILFHNESSHLSSWPMKQFFYCVMPAEEGGETPIVDCREIYAAIPDEIIEQFERRGLMYVRNFTKDLDLSWQDFFKTDDPRRVEACCESAHIEYEWKGDALRICQRRPAIVKHSQTGERIFFNQIQLHHTSCLAPEVRDALLSIFAPEDLPRSVYFGEGSPIDNSLVQLMTEIYWRHAVSFSWQLGDILMLDNMLVAHARNPYRGKRKIVVAMGDMFTGSDS